MKLWIPGQYLDSWNISKRAYDAYINSGLIEGIAKFSSGSYNGENYPSKVKAAP